MSNADIRGRFIWHELMTTDTDAAGAFYSKVMPWKTQPSGMPGYTLWVMGKARAGGLMALPEQQGAGPHWLTYIGTPSVDSTLEGVQRLGGKVVKGATDIPNVGRYAVVSDPQGVTFALYTPAPDSSDGANMGGGAALGAYSWHELATTDVNGAISFYTELFGWEKGPAHPMGGDVGDYQLIVQGGQQIGGMYKSSPAAMPPSWLTYVNVADIDKAANAVKGGGGRIINGPMQVPGGSWIAQATDPQGGMFAVIEVAPVAAAEQPAAPEKASAPKPVQPKPAQAKPAAPKPAAVPKPQAAAPKPAAPPKPEAVEAKPAASASTAVKEPAARSAAASKPGAASKPAAARKAARKKAPAKKAAAKAGRKKVAKKAAAKRAAKPAAKRAAGKRGKKVAGARRGKAKAGARGKAKAKARRAGR